MILIYEIIFGIIGAVFIIFSWLWETKKLAKTRTEKVTPLHPELTLIGVFLLIIYSYLIGDSIFLILNIFVAFMAGMTLRFALKRKKPAKRRKK